MAEKDKCEWQDAVSLKEYLESRIDAVKDSITTAQIAMEKRLEGMNEFRETLRDQASKLVTRAELDSRDALINSDIRVLREAKATLDGKASQFSLAVAMVLAIAGLIVGIIGWFVRG